MSQEFERMRTVLDEKYTLIEQIIITDELTQIYNRKFYNDKVLECMSLYHRYQTPFCIIMYDIDNFKNINDSYGHSIGDKVLIQMSALVQSLLRDSDYLFRIGGEEFIVLLPQIQLSEAKNVAEKIRKNVSTLEILEDEAITVSIGVAQMGAKDTEDSLYHRVDELLYVSKNHGKNRVSS
ncbi:MAG: GGDEF domain-containing protein [Sulfurovum sp.]|nr:GGDEF domain-containing protein [Sulfurovum sp.]